MGKTHMRWDGSPVDWVNQHFGKIQERVVIIDLGTVRAAVVCKDFVFENNPAARIAHPPRAFVEVLYGQRLACGIGGSHAVDVLGEVAHLIESVPNGQLNRSLRVARRQLATYVKEVFTISRERNGVLDVRLNLCEDRKRQAGKQQENASETKEVQMAES